MSNHTPGPHGLAELTQTMNHQEEVMRTSAGQQSAGTIWFLLGTCWGMHRRKGSDFPGGTDTRAEEASLESETGKGGKTY